MTAAPTRRTDKAFPFLSGSWLDNLQAEKWLERNVNEYATRAELQEWLESRDGAAADPCSVMSRFLDKTLDQLDEEGENAHDIMNRCVFLLLNYAHEGHSGIIDALEEVKEKFVEVSHHRRMKTRRGEGDNFEKEPRGEFTALAEFYRSRDGAIRILMVDTETIPSCYCLSQPDRPDDENAPGYHAEYNDPSHYRDSDLGLAKFFFDLHKWDFCWLGEEEKWILWDGTTWQRDESLQIHRMAWDVSKRMEEALVAMGDAYVDMEKAGADDEALQELAAKMKHLAGRANQAEELPRVKRLIETARALPNVARSLSDFDEDPRALGVENGVLELLADGSVNLRAGTRADRITRTVRVPYDEDATSKHLDKYFRLFVPDLEVRHYLQKFLGYSLLGGNPERRIAFFIGRTSTGKSTLMEAVIAMMGEYGGPLPTSIFRANNEDKPRPDIIRAKPRRIISTSELDEKTPIHADQLKKLISVDSLPARGMHKDAFDERPASFTPFIASNVTPTVPGADAAFRKRLVVFPFNQSVAGTAKDDKHMTDRFKTDPEILTALLAWMVEGYKAYCAEGLDDMPKVMTEQADSFMAGTNHAQEWFTTHFIKAPGEWVATDSIQDSYDSFCDQNDISKSERLSKQRGLPHFLEDMGFKRGKVHRAKSRTIRTREGYRFRTEKEMKNLHN